MAKKTDTSTKTEPPAAAQKAPAEKAPAEKTPAQKTAGGMPRSYPAFANDQGAEIIKIGVREFECMGARAPHDHPHVYLDMGDDTEIICPYCSTLYRLDAALGRLESDPADAFVGESQRDPLVSGAIGPNTPGSY